MIERRDLKEYIKELFYIEEDALVILDGDSLSARERGIIKDNLTEKQVILSKMLRIISELE